MVRRRAKSIDALDSSMKLEDLQGRWENCSTNAQILVEGISICMNGEKLKDHHLVTRDDGTVQSIEQSEMKRRRSLGVGWSMPDGAIPDTSKCRWLLYGMREGKPIWKENAREVLWRRPLPPVTLETLQGDWVNSMGAKINVEDVMVSLNGCKMEFHPVTLREDGTVKSIGKLWQLKGWQEEGKLEFKEAPSEDCMEYARSVIWTVASEERLKQWAEQMKGLGYAGSSADVHNRGIEGCMPGTCDAGAKLDAPGHERDLAEAKMLNDLIHSFMEEELILVKPNTVIPDFTNRGQTGLSLEHAHFIANSMMKDGFKCRGKSGDHGHDIPVVVREGPGSETAGKAIQNWKKRLLEDKGFAPWYLNTQEEFFTSLGNGHFYQALNLIRMGCPNIYQPGKNYDIGADRALRDAIENGVTCVVLTQDVPLKVRAKIAELLNSKREYRWSVDEDGAIEIGTLAEINDRCSQFEALSKVLDAQELNCLVRNHLGITDSERIGT
jgi:hypothetical protein